MKGRVLDVGGKRFGRRGDFVPPLDQVESWKYLNSDEKSQPDYFCTAEDIPLEDASTDTVIMTEVLEYLPYPQKVFAEIYRVLVDKGHAIISVPLLNPIHGDHWADRVRYTPVILQEMVEESGFKIKVLETMGSVGAVIYDILRVAFDYADEPGTFRIMGRLLPRTRFFFSWLDVKMETHGKFINTGYFMVMTK